MLHPSTSRSCRTSRMRLRRLRRTSRSVRTSRSSCWRISSRAMCIPGANWQATEPGSEWWSDPLSSIGRDTALVAIETAHWTDGTLFDLVAVGRRCREVGAWFVVDATQTIGIEPVDAGAIFADALVAHPYKSLLAHYGLGFAYFSDRLADGSPLEESWLMRRGG